MDLHRLKDSIAEMHLKFTSAGAICYMLMLTPTANFAVDPDQTVPRRAVRFGSKVFATKTSYGQTNIVDLDQTALREQFNPDPHCSLQRLDWNNLAEHKWRFAGVLMMAQHCWLSSFLIFQGILISIAKKPYISYDFSGGGGSGAPAPPPPPTPPWIITS